MLILYGLQPLEMAHWAPPPFWVYVPPSSFERKPQRRGAPPPPPNARFLSVGVSPSQGTSRLDSFTASSLPPFSLLRPTGCLKNGSKRPPLWAFGQTLLGVLFSSACADILLSFPAVAKGKTLSGGSSTRASGILPNRPCRFPNNPPPPFLHARGSVEDSLKPRRLLKL